MQLAREVRNLDREMQPSRDLWAGIERRIEAHPQPKKAEPIAWMRYGMAASVLMAFFSFGSYHCGCHRYLGSTE